MIRGNMIIDASDLGAERYEKVDNPSRRRFSSVRGVLLVGEAQQEDRRAADRLTEAVEALRDPLDHMIGHVLVDVVGEINEAEPTPGRLLDMPGQIGGIDGQAVAADTGAGME